MSKVPSNCTFKLEHVWTEAQGISGLWHQLQVSSGVWVLLGVGVLCPLCQLELRLWGEWGLSSESPEQFHGPFMQVLSHILGLLEKQQRSLGHPGPGVRETV